PAWRPDLRAQTGYPETGPAPGWPPAGRPASDEPAVRAQRWLPAVAHEQDRPAREAGPEVDSATSDVLESGATHRIPLRSPGPLRSQSSPTATAAALLSRHQS